MGTEMQTLNERIAERVGNELVDLIPPEQWRSMIDSQVSEFTREKLPQIVDNILTEELHKNISALLNSPEWADQWDSQTGATVNTLLVELMKKAAPEIFASMLEPITSGFMQALRQQFNNHY